MSGDLIDHDTSGTADCICGPTVVPVERDDGSIGWVHVHHTLAGVELADPGPKQAAVEQAIAQVRADT